MITYNTGSALDMYSLSTVWLNALVVFIYNIKTQGLYPDVLHMMLCLFTSTLYADELEQPRPKSIKMPSESESIDSKIWSTMFSGLEEGTGIKDGSLSNSKDLCGSSIEWKSPFCCSAVPSLPEHSTDPALDLSWSPDSEFFVAVMEFLEPLSITVVRLEYPWSSRQEVISETECLRMPVPLAAMPSVSYSATGVNSGLL